MPIGWVIALAVLAFFIFLFLLPLRVYISYQQDIDIYLRVLFLKIPLYPKKDKFRIKDYSRKKMLKKQQKAAKKAAKKKNKKQQSGKKISSRKPRSAWQTVRFILAILRTCQKRLRKSVSIRILSLKAKVATGDAATCAILYGAISQAFAYILEIAQSFLRFSCAPHGVAVQADFLGSKTELSVAIRLQTNLWRLLLLGIKACMAFIQEKIKNAKKRLTPKSESEEQKHGRQQVE